MCGISGKISYSQRVEETLLRKMNAVLAHRGPDDEGVYIHHGQNISVGLAHRRLSIMDLSSAGRQPMTNEDATIWLVFNGEIYNFPELREELLKKGHQFRSHTDSEVLIHLYEEEGRGCVKKLVGMFAFALWDLPKQRLFLGRDHIGIKPLVYAWNGQTFVFGSEIKGLLQDKDISRQLDPSALNIYLALNYIPAPFSIFKGINKLKPGHTLTIQEGNLTESPYWNLPLEGAPHRDPIKTLNELKDELFRVVDDAVRRQMVADISVGAFLSGGIDSSVIVALMARRASKPIKTYSIGYADMPIFDETASAKIVAGMYATDHHEITLTAGDILAVIPEVLSAMDEPFADSSAIPTFIVARETRRDVKAALSGDGGDELFAGYRMYKGEGLYAYYRQIPKWIRKGLIRPVIGFLPDSRDTLLPEYIRRAKKFIHGAQDSLEERFLAWNEIFTPDLRHALLLQHNDPDEDSARRIFVPRLQEMKDDSLNRMLYTDLKESLPGDMLWRVDTMSMRNALEVRVPLLDHRVCETAFSMPGAWKLHRGQAKYIFIETFKHLLPASVLTKPKRGFEIPISVWIKSDLKYLLNEYLSPERIQRQGIFHYPTVQILIEALLSNRRDTSWHLWNLMAFQVWYERYV